MYIIYKHTNKINNKCYIGQTIHSLKSRCGKNGVGYKKCTKFYRAILKYGWDNFTHEIIMNNLTKIEADFWERYYISLYDSIDKGYNIETGGKIEGNQYKKKVYQYDLDGNFIKEYSSSLSVAKEIDINNKDNIRSIINTCCLGRCKSAYGYQWSYIKKDKISKYKNNIIKEINLYQYDLNGNFIKHYTNYSDMEKDGFKYNSNLLYDKTFYGYYWSKIYLGENIINIKDIINIRTNAIKMYQYSLNGNYIKCYNSIKEVINEFGKGAKSLRNPKTKISCGYQWRRKFEGYKISSINTSHYKKIAQYDLNHNLLNIYNNMTEAYKSLGLNCKHSYIAQCCQYKRKEYHNYLWEYYVA